jgi:Bacterial Ig domain
MRRLLVFALLATLALAAPAAAAVPGVNVTNTALSETGWARLQASGAKTVRVWAFASQIRQNPATVNDYRAFAQRAASFGTGTLITLMGAPGSNAPPDPGAYAQVATQLAAGLRGSGVIGYEVWNEPDDAPYWAPVPNPAAYAALLRAAYPAFKAGDPGAAVVTGGMVANHADFLQALYAAGAKGSFDAVGIHTDTACLTADPREYYREPSGRIGRYSFTGYREVRQTMLANGDDKPIWMTEIGWSTTPAICNVGDRAGTKPGGVSAAQQADFLAKAYGCLANDPYVAQAMWFSLWDVQTADPRYDHQLGLMDDQFNLKPAFAAFQGAGGAGAIPCGVAVDLQAPTVRIGAPTNGAIYLAALKIAVAADDNAGVTNLDLFVDGKEIPVVTKSQTATAAKVSLDWQGAKRLAYGPHTLLVKAYDEAKNVGTATARFTKVGGGKYKIAIGTKIRLALRKVAHRRMSVRGKVIPAQKLASVAGKTQVTFERRQGRRWIGTSRFSKGAKTPFKFTYRFKTPGTWRVKARFIPKKGSSYKRSSLRAKLIRVP